MLSESLKLYFKTWETQLWVERPCEKCFKKSFKIGFLEGYRACFGEALKLDWSKCPADFSILDQVTLTRNRDQHPDDITALHTSYDEHTRSKHPQPFFVRESERASLQDPDSADSTWFYLTLHVSRETLFGAIEQVELLADWLEERMFAADLR